MNIADMAGSNPVVDIVVMGHILNEKIVFPDREIYPVLGSPVAYSSVCMSSLGIKVGIVTKIGKDFPQKLFKVFDEVGVDRTGVAICPNSTNNELIYDEKGSKVLKFLTKADDVCYDDIPSKYYDAKIFCFSPMDYEVGIETMKSIKKLGKVTAADIGGYGGGTSDSYPVLKNGDEIREMCPYLDIIKGSIEDYGHIFGAGIGDEKQISENILKWGTKISLVTLGKEGAFFMTENDCLHIPAYPSEDIIDRTGAGDCFFAGFLAKYIGSRDPFLSSIYGNATTSYVIERSGGVVKERMPDIKEVEKRAELIRGLMK
jgi:sugar/nucleoside kinase (ribokinase family)